MSCVFYFIILTGLFLTQFISIPAEATTFYVSPAGSNAQPGTEILPWQTVQHAVDNVTAGDTILILDGVYQEKVVISVSGNSTDGHITLQNYPEHTPIIDGSGQPDNGGGLIAMLDQSYLKIIGFTLRNLDTPSAGYDGAGIVVEGYGDNIEIRNCTIHEIRGVHAMGIRVYGTNPGTSISNLVIDDNLIFDCDPATSEALTLNGNVELFEITDNIVHDLNNIGIDMIGGEGTCSNPANDICRNGICRANEVYNARSNYGGGYAAGIYVDGGADIIIEANTVYQCDLGIEIGAENQGHTTANITVRNNLLYNNDKTGLVFGGYDYPNTGKVIDSSFMNNTCYHNDILNEGLGELWIQYAENCAVEDNIFYSTDSNVLIYSEAGPVDLNNQNVTLDYNLWYTPGGPDNVEISLGDQGYYTFGDYQAGTGQDANSLFADPQFLEASLPDPDLHLNPDTSPAIDAGNPEVQYNDACLPPGLGSVTNDSGAYGGPGNCLPVTVNTAPTTGGIADVNVNEDAADSVINLGDAFEDNEDADADLTYTIEGNTNPAIFTGLSIEATNLVLDYAPEANGSADLTIRATDTGQLFAETTFTVTVNPVNDPPSFIIGEDQLVSGAAGPQTVIGWATGISAGPSNEADQVLAFLVDNDYYDLFANQPDISLSGDLTYSPAIDLTGSANVTVVLQDDGGTADGGQDTSLPQGFIITVVRPGDADLDGEVNGSDVISTTNAILGSAAMTPAQFIGADVNRDGVIDISDIVGIIDLIVNR
ncbi:MAG: DUF1565 domain-containing protein [Planctomycetes bacterium]|nr:DUF1565 domain-containing protein [Planctomycetota bacterium]